MSIAFTGATTGGKKPKQSSFFLSLHVLNSDWSGNWGIRHRVRQSYVISTSISLSLPWFNFSSSPWAQEGGKKNSHTLSLCNCELPWDSTWEMVSVQHHSRCSLSHSHIARHLFLPRSQLTPTAQVPSHPPLITYNLLAKLKSTVCSKVKPFQTNLVCFCCVVIAGAHHEGCAGAVSRFCEVPGRPEPWRAASQATLWPHPVQRGYLDPHSSQGEGISAEFQLAFGYSLLFFF